MSQFISPGVYTLEQDLSAYVSNLSATIVGMVGTSDTGPTNTPVLITSQSDFVNTFGQVNPNHYLGYAAMAYLSQGQMLWVTRVSPSDATKAKSSMVLPASYTPFAGNWTLQSQTATSMTLALTDASTATGASKVIAFNPTTDATVVIPNFDFTDTTGISPSINKLGSDLNSFITANQTGLITGNSFSVTLGAGKGTTATITGLSAGTPLTNGTPVPNVTLPISAFSSLNSPTTATAVGSIGIATVGTFTPPTNLTPMLVFAESANNTPVRLLYSNAGTATTTLAGLTSTTQATVLSTLEGLLTVTSGSVYDIAFPMEAPTSVANNSVNLQLAQAIFNALLTVVNLAIQPAPATYPKTSVIWSDLRVASTASSIYGVGSIVSGLSRGFSAISALTDSLNNTIQVRLSSLVTGANGTFLYSAQTPAPLTPLIVADQVISGQFTMGLSRPTWVMSQAGTSWIPTIFKFTTLGEADASDTAITLNINSTNLTSTGLQNYTVRIYERNVSTLISTTSVQVSDFSLVEQYDGTPEIIQSLIAANSRRVALKIDYTTADTVNYTTGIVTHGIPTDNLTPSFVLATSEINQGVSEGLNYTLNSSGAYVRVFADFLLGGSAGSSITSSTIIGDGVSTGLYSFANPETLDINLLVAPGWSSDPAVSKAMISICTTRGDAFAIIDPPFGLDVQSVVSYRTTLQNINSSYGAMYYPWVQINDSVNNKNIFVPPSSLVTAQYAYNDQVADVYYAPAGVNRGMLTTALATERTLSLGDRDYLCLNQVNPIHNDASQGIYIKGQYTLQTATTALDRVNVRRLLLKLRKVVATASKTFEFELNDSTTAYRLKQVAETVLEDHLKKGAIQSYTVDVGPSVNTVLSAENNELRMNISLVPTKAAERIIETFIILPQAGGITVS